MTSTEAVIIDVTGYDDWPDHKLWAGQVSLPTGGKCILGSKVPTVIQVNQSTAEQEAARLAKANPGHRFAVFVLAGVVETKQIPTHITLGGKVMGHVLKPVWQETAEL